MALADDRIVNVQWFEGLSDTLRNLTDAVGGAPPAPLVRLQRDLESAYDSRPATLAAARQWLDRLGAGVAEVAAYVSELAGPDSSTSAAVSEAAFWTDALVRQVRTLQDEVSFLAPWSALPVPPTGLGDLPGSAKFRRCASSRRPRGEIAAMDRAPRGRDARGARVARSIERRRC